MVTKCNLMNQCNSLTERWRHVVYGMVTKGAAMVYGLVTNGADMMLGMVPQARWGVTH